MSRVSIIMAAYNGSEYIGEQIESIFNSTCEDWILYIFDDCSTDNTVEIVNEYIKKKPSQIKLIKNRVNKGSTATFIDGARYIHNNAPTPYYVFCDQDDVWMIDKLETSLEGISRLEKKYGHKVPALAYADAMLVDGELNYLSNSFFKASRLWTHRNDFSDLLIENKVLGCTSIFNDALAAKLTEINNAVRYHDWWVALIASAFGHISFIKTQTILYRQHGNNQVGQNDFGEYVEQRMSQTENISERLEKTFEQADHFAQLYFGMMSRRKKKILKAFLKIRKSSPVEKRMLILRHGFFKSGIIRNIGLLFYV